MNGDEIVPSSEKPLSGCGKTFKEEGMKWHAACGWIAASGIACPWEPEVPACYLTILCKECRDGLDR